MDHIGIDLGSKDSQVCVRTAAGEIVGEWWCRTDRLIASLQDRPRGRVIVETCTEAFGVAALAQRAGHEVRVVAATLVRSLGVGHRGLKNDVRDARVLSEASCRMDLPSVHIPTAISQDVKGLCVSREALIKTRTQLIGRVRGYVRARLGRVLRATPESLPKRVRKALLEDPEGLPSHLERVLGGVGDRERTDCGGRHGAAHARPVRRADVSPDDGARGGPRHLRPIRRGDRRHWAIPDGRECRVVSRFSALTASENENVVTRKPRRNSPPSTPDRRS